MWLDRKIIHSHRCTRSRHLIHAKNGIRCLNSVRSDHFTTYKPAVRTFLNTGVFSLLYAVVTIKKVYNRYYCNVWLLLYSMLRWACSRLYVVYANSLVYWEARNYLIGSGSALYYGQSLCTVLSSATSTKKASGTWLFKGIGDGTIVNDCALLHWDAKSWENIVPNCATWLLVIYCSRVYTVYLRRGGGQDVDEVSFGRHGDYAWPASWNNNTIYKARFFTA